MLTDEKIEENSVDTEQMIQRKEDILAQIFAAYGITDRDSYRRQAQTLDALAEYYVKHNDLATLNRMIELVRYAASQSAYTESDAVSEICKAVMKDPESNVSLDELAKTMFFSVHYLRHMFRKKTGMTFKEFKTAQRINKAKLLLRIDKQKIVDIARVCGFEKAYYFTLVFTKEVGIPPSEFRKECREGKDVSI